MSSGEHRLALPAGYELGKYRLREVLGSGGFGITYLAEDRMLSRRVAIKELLPNDIATRIDGTTVAAKTKGEEESLTWARERFVNEGRALAACDHPNVVHVYEMVEANGTAYMVTKYEEGRSLERWLKELGRPPTEEELRGILAPLLSGLDKVHGAGFLHRDIKPDNIYLTSDGRPVLLDFGSARQAVSNRSMAMTSIVTSGYAPFEQYYEDGNQGPWSDIYAMGAVMYRAIVGKKPPESTRRLKDDPCEKLASRHAGQYSAVFLKAIDKALSVNESKRPQSVTEWRTMLGDDPHDAATIVKRGSPKPRELQGFALVKEMLKTRPWIAPAAGVGAVTLGLLIWQMARPTPGDHGKNKNIAVNPSPSVAPSPGPMASASPAVAPTSTPVKIVQAESPAPTATPPPSIPADSPIASATPALHPGQPIETPAPSPIAELSPAPSVQPSPNAIPASDQPVVESGLVGSWQTGTTKSKRIRWDVWADGHWICSGAINDSGTLTATDGRMRQFSNTTQQYLDTAYEFDEEGALTTRNELGAATWHKVNSSTTSNSPSTSSHHKSSGNSSRSSRSGDQIGRQILGRFLQGHGW